MLKKIVYLAIVIAFIIGGAYLFYPKKLVDNEDNFKILNSTNMILESPVFEHNFNIPVKYTCDGEDINPPFKIFKVPAESKSLVLIADDPDASMGDWVHWVLWNIDPETEEIREGSVPLGAVLGLTSFGSHGYGGPCPPSGEHHYYFKLYALDTWLELSSEANKDKLLEAMQNHILTQTELIGLYRRQ